jgi:hypothetical protein
MVLLASPRTFEELQCAMILCTPTARRSIHQAMKAADRGPKMPKLVINNRIPIMDVGEIAAERESNFDY